MAEYFCTIDQCRVRQMAKSTLFYRSMSSNPVEHRFQSVTHLSSRQSIHPNGSIPPIQQINLE